MECIFCSTPLGLSIESDANGVSFHCCQWCNTNILHGNAPQDIYALVETRATHAARDTGTRKVTVASCRARLESGKPLTLPQGKHLMVCYEDEQRENDARRRSISTLATQLAQMQDDLAVEKQHWTQLARDYNGLTAMLDAVLGVRVEAHDASGDTWDVTDTASGVVQSSGYERVTEAYRSALHLRMDAIATGFGNLEQVPDEAYYIPSED